MIELMVCLGYCVVASGDANAPKHELDKVRVSQLPGSRSPEPLPLLQNAMATL